MHCIISYPSPGRDRQFSPAETRQYKNCRPLLNAGTGFLRSAGADTPTRSWRNYRGACFSLLNATPQETEIFCSSLSLFFFPCFFFYKHTIANLPLDCSSRCVPVLGHSLYLDRHFLLVFRLHLPTLQCLL